MDNRLDYINNFKDLDVAAADMSEMRKSFMAIDAALVEIMEVCEDVAGQRALAIARTHVETAQMYAIKGLCLFHEDKPE
jgi:hypothetical protein